MTGLAPWRYAVLDTAGELHMRELPADAARPIQDLLTALQREVGGWLEQIPVGGGLVAFVNEDGHAMGLAPNSFGLAVLAELGVRLGYPLVLGNLLITGTNPVDVDSLTDDQADRVRAAYAKVTGSGDDDQAGRWRP